MSTVALKHPYAFVTLSKNLIYIILDHVQIENSHENDWIYKFTE